MKIPEFLKKKAEVPADYRERMELSEKYQERYGEVEWDDYMIPSGVDNQEIADTIRLCLQERKRMRDIRPEWCEVPPPEFKL